ncbi:glutamine--fructose-6-phosphate transaminase (isomerizing) [soil metagenome]
MCGIVGYVGPNSAIDVLLGGLKRLEYRGYDSAGVAVLDESGHMDTRKKAGKLGILADDLSEHPLPDGHTGIGHTRWATHGGPTDDNAHPHLGDGGKLALIHNGIIENFAELKQELVDAGATFTSETDTEVAALMVGDVYNKTGDLTVAMQRVVARLEGAFTLLVMHEDVPNVVVGARRNSPLVIGLGDGENFLGSDVAAFVEHTKRAMEIGQDEIVTIRPDSVEVTDFAGNPVPTREFEVAWDASAAEKGGWSSFMKKEISEEPEAVGKTLLGRVHDGAVTLTELDAMADVLAEIDRVVIVACGTAAYAGMLGKYAIEKWARIPVEVELSHEFRYRDPVIDGRTLVVSVSQSGETMDTLMAVKYAREQGANTLSICNTQGSTIPRESDGVIYIHAGPEVAVASTKAFVAQVTALYLLGLDLARRRGTLDADGIAAQVEELQNIPAKLDQVLESTASRIAEFAPWLGDTQSVLFLGRHVGYAVALEGALKLKEVAYIHAEGFAAGELKHGPIALIEPGQIVIVLVPSPRHENTLHPKVVSNIQEIRARGARVIAIAELGDVAVVPFADEVIRIPFAGPLFEPLLGVVPLHIFAMELAMAKGLDVDQPRNLAKSVTVE